MFSDKKPPEAKHSGDFPSFDSVVTVPNCWYYLSLLERFVDITSSMPQYVLKIYLVRAEYRYFRWMYKSTRVRFIKDSIPPIDVAFFWQAHLLSPVRYQEDIIRMKPFNKTRIPLKEIHEAQGYLKKSVIHEWASIMNDEPYDLTREALLKKGSCAFITCIVCSSRIRSPWEEYAEWRTDHTIALQCCCCYTSFTVKHVGKSNLNQDNASKGSDISGLMIDPFGLPYKPEYIKQSLRPGRDIMLLPFDQGLKPLDEYLEEKEKSPFNSITSASRKKMIEAIQSTYLCTPYRGSSIDLIQAVARQYKFAVKATKEINWRASQGIIRGIRDYTNFLAMIKENKHLIAVPTYEIDLAWHTHMLHHKNYQKMCLALIGKMINHDDTIPEDDLASYVKITEILWEARNKRLKEARIPPPLPVHDFSSIEEKNKESKDIKKTGFRNKIKSFVSKPDDSEAKTRNRPIFEIKYITGNYKCPPRYKLNAETSVVEINNDSGYEPEKVSFHDKADQTKKLGDIGEFINLNSSDEIMDATFSNVKKSIYGFIGTSTCGNTELLNQWNTELNDSDCMYTVSNCVSSKTSSYTKVFQTKGNKTAFIVKRKRYEKARRKYLSFHNIENEKMTFDWPAVMAAWIKAAGDISELAGSFSTCGGWGNCEHSGGDSFNLTSGCGGGASGCGGGGGASGCGGGGGASGCGGGGSC